MDVGAGWCQKCWANWSVWFMRAGGTWLNLDNGLSLKTNRCDCFGCALMRDAIAQADLAERRILW